MISLYCIMFSFLSKSELEFYCIPIRYSLAKIIRSLNLFCFFRGEGGERNGKVENYKNDYLIYNSKYSNINLGFAINKVVYYYSITPLHYKLCPQANQE